jgi:hypothetical protein
MTSIINSGHECSPPNSGAPRSPHSDTQSPASTAVATPISNNGEVLGSASEDVKRPVLGWPLLAKIMAGKPDLEAFPSFTDLNIKSLLYYQAELVSLRSKLHKAEYDDCRNTDTNEPASSYAYDLDFLFAARDNEDDPADWPEQWKLMERMRIVLTKYSKRL